MLVVYSLLLALSYVSSICTQIDVPSFHQQSTFIHKCYSIRFSKCYKNCECFRYNSHYSLPLKQRFRNFLSVQPIFRHDFNLYVTSTTTLNYKGFLKNDKSWTCELEFNESLNVENDPKCINFSDELKSDSSYSLPSHFDGIDKKKSLIITICVMCLKI